MDESAPPELFTRLFIDRLCVSLSAGVDSTTMNSCGVLVFRHGEQLSYVAMSLTILCW